VFADAHHNLGVILRELGRLEEAERSFSRALALDPGSAQVMDGMGVLRQKQGRWAEAIEYHQKAAVIQPNSAVILNHIGQALKGMEKLDEAFEAHKQALRVDPNNAMTLFLMGTVAMDSYRPDLAVNLLTAASRLRPNDRVIAGSLGYALIGARRYDEAIALATPIIQASPNWMPGHYLLALAHSERGDDQVAYNLGSKAFAMDPDNVALISLMASVAHQVGRDEECLAYTSRMLEQRPQDGVTHWLRGIVLLGMGQLEEGWKEFEWRLRSEQHAHLHRPDLKAPAWQGGADMTGKKILLHCEGGFGDALHFIRYLPMVLETGAEVSLECPKEMYALFKRLPGLKGLFVRGEALPEFDYQCPLLGLPLRFKTTLKTIPARIPYLSAEPELIEAWKQRLAKLDRNDRKVGLVWAGSFHPQDLRTRSLAALAPLATIDGVQFVSLQRGKEAVEAKNPPPAMKLAEYTDELSDFAQAAGLVENLDLVITVDTAAAHLAGALGKAVWVMIPACADFRWLLQRQDSPWYPTLRLFRQKHGEAWQEVIQRIAQGLGEWIQAKGRSSP